MGALASDPESGGAVQRGRAGEDAAESFYRRRFYKVLGRNVRVGRGEIDLVVRRGNRLVFVEVKARGPEALDSGAGAVDHAKRAKLIRAAEGYLAMLKGAENCEARFDILEIELDGSGRPGAVHHIEDAFRADENF